MRSEERGDFYLLRLAMVAWRFSLVSVWEWDLFFCRIRLLCRNASADATVFFLLLPFEEGQARKDGRKAEEVIQLFLPSFQGRMKLVCPYSTLLGHSIF